MDTIMGQRVKAEDGQEGTVVAVEHSGGGGGPAGWQLLLVTDDSRLTVVYALNAQLVTPDPLEPYRGVGN